MIDEPLLTITRVVDCDLGNSMPGDLDYRIHCSALEMWLSRGDVDSRRAQLATELRELADKLDGDGGPFKVTIEFARKRKAHYEQLSAERGKRDGA